MSKKPATLFHGSPYCLEVLEPLNLHGDSDIGEAVFASPSRAFALAFSGSRWGDNQLNLSTEGSFKKGTARIVLSEMCPYAFEHIYGGKGGYLYTVPSDSFSMISNRKNSYEQVSTSSVTPLKVEKMTDVLTVLEGAQDVRMIRFSEIKKKDLHRIICRRALRAVNNEKYKEWWLASAHEEVKQIFMKEYLKINVKQKELKS